MADWISVFLIMKGVLTDKGGEFINEELREVEAMLNIEPLSTAAESPFQNGLCKRNHQVVDLILSKLVSDFPRTPIPVLLKWASMSKNTSQMVEGFSSHQLFFGRNPNLPNLLESTPATLEESTMSQRFHEYLSGLHAARLAFMESESSEIIKKALRHKVKASETVFSYGDKVFYKRDQCDRWLGPAKIIFEDGKVIFIRHGAVWVKVSPNRVVKSGAEFSRSEQLHDPVVEDLSDKDTDIGEDLTSSAPWNTLSYTASKDEHTSTDASNDERQTNNEEQVTTGTDAPNIERHAEVEEQIENRLPLGLRPLQDHNNKGLHETDHPVSIVERPEVTKVLDAYTPQSGFMSTVPSHLHKSPKYLRAKKEELDKLSLFDVYEEVENIRQTTVDTRWVITYKGDGIKARIVAKGFQEV